MTMKRHYAFLGIKDVTEVIDSYAKMDEAFKELLMKCTQADLSKGKTTLLVYVYAATHGAMYNGATKT